MSERDQHDPDETPRRGRHRRPDGAGPPPGAPNPGPRDQGPAPLNDGPHSTGSWQPPRHRGTQPPFGGQVPANGFPTNGFPTGGFPANGYPVNGQPTDGQQVDGQQLNGRPVNGHNGHATNGNSANGHRINGYPLDAPVESASTPPRVLRAAASIPSGAPAEEAPDLMAVQSDDAFIDALSRGYGGGGWGGGGGGDDDRIAEMLAAWKAEVDAEPIPELVDVDTALATIMAVTGGPVDVPTTVFEAVRPEPAASGGEDDGVVTPMRPSKRPGKRARHLVPLAGAAALIIAAIGGVSLGAHDAQPGDALFGVTQVLYQNTAQSRQAAVDAQAGLVAAKESLAQGDTSGAAQQLTTVEQLMAKVNPEDGAPVLAANQKFLTAKLQETPAGEKVDPETPLRDGTPPPAPPAIPGKPSKPTTPSTPPGSVTSTPSVPPTSATTQPPETTTAPTSSSAASTSATPKPTSEGNPDPSTTTSGMGTTTNTGAGTGTAPATRPS